jgi:ferric-dicitrate binding protein FerR (iron transport regulator)
MKEEKLIELARKWMAGRATDRELQQLHRWYDRWEEDEELVVDNDGDKEEIRIRILARIQEQIHQKRYQSVKLSFVKRYVRQIAAAAAIILIVGSYFLFFQNNVIPVKPMLANDIKAPEVNRAMITLSNGQHVYLDNANSGQLAVQGKVNLIKLSNGEIAYQSQNESSGNEMIFNTLTNPKGSRIVTITMADGTKIWLNAGSSLTYPVSFAANERKVTISGEAYLEVSHHFTSTSILSKSGKEINSKNKVPFIVITHGVEVKVLGTHLNINAYDDENTVKTTLLEGSVKVSSLITHQSSLITPGQQASLDSQGKINITEVDTEASVAWKNGLFKFNDADIETVMRQIARWYNVEVVYESKPTKLFRGEMPRNMSAANVFRVLEETGGVHFRIEGKTIVVIK